MCRSWNEDDEQVAITPVSIRKALLDLSLLAEKETNEAIIFCWFALKPLDALLS